jgi:Raf kinase inhibitor-like YbhB/YbcL family protein
VHVALSLHSPAFDDGDRIPDRYSRSHGNVSPPLEWTGVPKGTRSFALILVDPDGTRGIFRHWAAFDIAPDRQRLDEGAGGRGSDLRQGANDFGETSYDGPQPPEGHGPHHYHFRLAALDTDHLDIDPEQRAETIWRAAQDHVLEEAELTGIYER